MRNNELPGLSANTHIEINDAPPLVPLELDPDEYMADLGDLDITEAQKAEFLETLWAILVQVAHMGFHYDVCGQMLEEFNQVTDEGASTLKSDRSTNKEKPAE